MTANGISKLRDDDHAVITADFSIPITKIRSASMLVANEYQGIAEQALREAKVELYRDSDFYNSLKNSLKEKIISTVKRSVESQLDKIVYEICNSSYTKSMINDAVKRISNETNDY